MVNCEPISAGFLALSCRLIAVGLFVIWSHTEPFEVVAAAELLVVVVVSESVILAEGVIVLYIELELFADIAADAVGIDDEMLPVIIEDEGIAAEETDMFSSIL